MTRCSTFLAATLLTVATLSTVRASAQAIPAARRPGGELRVGATYSNANTDEIPKRIGGFTAYADYTLLPHFSLEADVHLLQFFTPNDYAQRSYVAGGRFFYRKRRYEPYAKVMGGIADSIKQLPYVNVVGTPDSYGILELGGGLDIMAPHHLVIRAIDYDFQHWGKFPPHGLTPSIISFGVAYRIK